jgi:hypothetical protein
MVEERTPSDALKKKRGKGFVGKTVGDTSTAG